MKNIQQVMKPFYKVVTIAISLSITTTMSFAQNLERRGDNNKCGYVESGAKKGFMGWKFVIKDNFTCSSKEFDKETNLAIVQSHSNNKWGIINTKGETIIPFEYSEELSMSKGKIAAKKDGKWGLLDTSGKTVLPFEYDYMKPESTDKTTVLFVRKGETLTEKELNHENIHSIQWRETWYIGFALLYVFHLLYLLLVYWNFHKAYRNICFELEAYNNDDYPNYLIYREKYAWKDYL